MKRLLMKITLLAGCLLTAGSAAAFTYWNDIRASALLPGNLVTIRTESAQGAGLVNTILYAQSGVQETSLSAVVDGPSTLEATVLGPVSGRRYYGFRLVEGAEIDLLPVWLAGGATPARTDLSRLSDDPIGDEAFGRINLDLTDCRLSSDGTRLFAALSNAGGGFPVNSGLTFFSYLLGIKDPAVANPDVLFGMIHTITAAGIIEPGLYQINGTGVNDLVKIGDITATEYPGENTLVLSCLLADLLANPVFQSWYDPADPRIDVAGFTQKITVLGGVEEADSTPGGVWHLREVALDAGANQLPQLSNFVIPDPGVGGFVSIVYSDADGHCPVISELVFDDTDVYPLRPQTLDYGVPVAYRSATDIPPLVVGGWTHVVARFSDNLTDVVELAEVAVGVADGGPGLLLRAAPNPFSGQTQLAFAIGRAQPVRLVIYDLAGRRVTTLVDGPLPAGNHAYRWDGRDAAGRSQSAGVYFYHLRSAEQNVVRRLTLLR